VAEYKGKDVSALPYRERRVICRQLVEELQPYCKNIHLAEAAPDGMDAVEFCDRVTNDPRGLPYSEGVVVKDLDDPSGKTWFKVKPRGEFFDWRIAPGGIVEGAGKYAGSAGAIMVEHPETGARSELGSLAVSDAERQWIWDHRTQLEGRAVAKFEAMEITDAGAVRAGVFNGLHHAKGNEAALQAIGLHELS
jgi:ATP-dependent DNA ligase